MSGAVAVLGANGFIGTRLVESLHLGADCEVRPLVRRASALAGLSRFDLDFRIADARDQAALERALDGCELVIHAVAGDPETIVGAIEPVYRAAERAGLRRIVYLSSASVHGQAPAADTDENSALSERHPIEYNNAKVRAERRLFAMREKGGVEVAVLRPGIVTGPRSAWIVDFAQSLLAGDACLVNAGRGICNSIYVDNLVQAVRLASEAPAADRQAFLVGDDEPVRWSDVYGPIANALGFDLARLPQAVLREERAGLRERIERLQSNRFLGSVIGLTPKRLRRMLYAGLVPVSQPAESAWSHPDWTAGHGDGPAVDLERYLLGTCQYRLPDTKARRVLGYAPAITFEEGMRRTIEWLRFAGYPVGECAAGWMSADVAQQRSVGQEAVG
jgi:nucleoside-diphosphate-sugar epimerase